MEPRAPSLGLRRLDAHQAAKIAPATHARYRKCISAFLMWLVDNDFNPVGACEFDDLVVEFKVDLCISKADFEGLLAGLEFVLPRLKGELKLARVCLAGWSIEYKAKRTVPLGRAPAHLVGCHICALGHPLLAIALLVQQELGLRPSEVLALHFEDVTLPEQTPGARGAAKAVLGLGMRAHTKAKRAQAVVLRDARLIGLLRFALSRSAPGDKVFPFTYEQYRRVLRLVETRLGLSMGWTPHSPRAGYATDRRTEGYSFV